MCGHCWSPNLERNAHDKTHYCLVPVPAPVFKAPVWEVLATEVKGSSVNVAHVNCDEGGSSTCTRFGVQTLPTLLYFTGDNYHEYKGLRTPQILIRYALETRKFDDRDLSVVPPKEPDTISTLVADVDWIYVACWLFLIGLFFWAVCDCCGGGGGHDGGDGDGDGGSRAGADGADETKGTKETRGGSSPAPHVSPERAVRQRGRKTKASSE